MANNNEPQTEIKSLKASFCRQHFPDLLQFLRDFNISSDMDESGNETNFSDDFNMHFLLQAYNDEKIPEIRYHEKEEDYKNRKVKAHANFLSNQRDQKENCSWSFNNVNESDVLLAIEEYFSIISERQDTEELSSILVRNILTNMEAFTIFTDKSIEKLYQFEDNTTLCILQHLGIKMLGEEKTLGAQRKAFAKFILSSTDTKENPQNKKFSHDLCSRRPEVRFIQAFELLASIRNWKNHEYVSFMSNKFNSYCLYRFILFTHIGLIYISRRIWKDPEASTYLTNNEYKEPATFDFEPSDLKVEISANNRTQNIYDCYYLFEDEKIWHQVNLPPQNLLSFTIKPKKYQLYRIKFKCNNQDYETLGKLNYYAWEPVLNIVVKPPKSVSYSFKGIAGDDKEMEDYFGELFTKYMNIYSNGKANDDQKNNCEVLLKELGLIEPLLLKIKESSENNEEVIDEIKAQISSQTKTIENQFSAIQEDLSGSKDRMKRWERFFKSIFIIVFIFTSIYALYFCINEPTKANVIWLKYPIILSISALLITYGSFITPCESWNPLKARKERGKAKWAFSSIVVLLFVGAFSVIPYHCGKDFIQNYNFLGQDSATNKAVVQYMDSKLPNKKVETLSREEEMICSKLALYYADIVGDLKKAENYSLPLLDVEKYKDGCLVAMYILYCQKEIPTLSSFIDRYKDCYGEDDPTYCDLKGALLVDTLYSYRDVHKGAELLWKAYEAGSISACYNLGYLYSNDESTMEAIEEGRNIQNSGYDLPLAIELLREISDEMPRASALLGDIYSDLGLSDSAFFYYEKAAKETLEGEIFKYAYYKAGVLSNQNGIKPNDALLVAQTLKFPPALMFSSIAMEMDKDLVKDIGENPFTRYFFLLFKKRDHKQAISWFEDAIKNGKDRSLKELGVFQYIPPVVFDYIYIGKKNEALAVLQKFRSGSKFDELFVNAIEHLLGSATVKQDSVKGMQLMHESAKNGCLYSKLFCLYRDTEKSLIKNHAAFIDTKQLKEMSKEIPFAHVLESFLLMRAGKIKEAEEAAHMALWKKHPAGAYAFEFMPYDYFDNPESGIANGTKNASEKELYLSRKLQEMSLRSTSTIKDRSLLMTCILDKALHDKTKEDFTDNFTFWTKVAIETNSLSSQITLLRIYRDMISEDYIDKRKIIDPLIRSALFNLTHGKFNYYPMYNTYILHFIKDRRLIPEGYYIELLRSYGDPQLLKRLDEIEGTQDKITINYHTFPLSFIDDFSILNEFTYQAGIYKFLLREKGNIIAFMFQMSSEEYFSQY